MSIISPILNRRSTVAFSPDLISREIVELVLAAATLAPSAYNEQPWRFYVVMRQHEAAFGNLLSYLAEPNKEWARNASALVVTASERVLSASGVENYYALHDLGMATALMLVQAQSMGWVSHVMGGFSVDALRGGLGIPESQIVGSVIALGVPGDVDALPAKLKARALSNRQRKALDAVASFV